MNGGRAVHVVAPDGLHDPRRPSGGNTYDRRVCAGLAAAGWSVHLRSVAGDWPEADGSSRDRLAEVLDATPAGSVLLADGLVALAAPDALVPASSRLRTVVLVHLPLSAVADDPGVREREAAVLRAAAAVVTTSDWTRRWLVELHGLDPASVQVAVPGADRGVPAPGGRAGGELLCVGAVTPVKGQDVLVAALAGVADRPWRCVCVGALDRDQAFVAALRRDIRAAGLGERVTLAGPLDGPALEAAYAAADVLLLTSRAETYGMVVTEALARGLPVLACDVGGVPEALGTVPGGGRPGMLTPAGDASAFAGSLRRWLDDPDLRGQLRRAARQRRHGLTGWAETAARVAQVLEAVAA